VDIQERVMLPLDGMQHVNGLSQLVSRHQLLSPPSGPSQGEEEEEEKVKGLLMYVSGLLVHPKFRGLGVFKTCSLC